MHVSARRREAIFTEQCVDAGDGHGGSRRLLVRFRNRDGATPGLWRRLAWNSRHA
jgi:hypothetical protein